MKLSVESKSGTVVNSNVRRYAEGYGKNYEQALSNLLLSIREEGIIFGNYFTQFWEFKVDNLTSCAEDKQLFLKSIYG